MSAVTDLIPHRPPFLFIDEIVSLDEHEIVATRLLRPDEDFYRGHYPDFPITPGVLLLEAMFQAGALLLSRTATPGEERAPVLTRIGKAKFRRIALPGETLTVRATLDQQIGDVFYIKAKTFVGDEMAVSVEYSCALVDKRLLLERAGSAAAPAGEA